MADDAVTLIDSEGHAFNLRPIHCPTCGPGVTMTLGYRGGQHHRYGKGVPTLLKRCRSCGLIFPDPFPFPAEPQNLYADPAKYFEHHDEVGKVEVNRALVRELVRRTNSEKPSVLDVGSGRGEFLGACLLEGLTDVTGLEFSEAMIAYAREQFGVEVLSRTIEEHADQVKRTYDAVVFNAVLEHVSDPDAMVAAAAKLTRPGSLLYIDTPNEPHLLAIVSNLYSKVRRSQTVYNLSPTFPPYHVYGFNMRALAQLLGKHGFRITESRIWDPPTVHSQPETGDRIKAALAIPIKWVANRTRTASNIFLWAERV